MTVDRGQTSKSISNSPLGRNLASRSRTRSRRFARLSRMSHASTGKLTARPHAVDGNVQYTYVHVHVPPLYRRREGADTSRHVRACISPRTVRSAWRSVGAIVHYGGRRIERVGQSKSDSKSSLSLHYFIEPTWCMVAAVPRYYLATMIRK